MPKLPTPVASVSYVPEVASISPAFLGSLPRQKGGAEFSSRDRLHLLVTEPIDVHSVLVANAGSFLKGEQEIALSKAIGWGLLGLEGEGHKRAQKTASPALRIDSLNSYISTIKQVAERHIDAIESAPPAPMRRALRCLSQEAAEKSLFSTKEATSDYSYQDHVFDLNAIVFSPELSSSSPQAALQLTRRYSNSRQKVMDHVSGLISSWKADRSTGTFLIDYLAGSQESGEGDFGHFHQQVSVFLQAATETTASLASWTIMLLSDHPEYWKKLQDEAKEVGSSDTYGSIMNLDLLEAVIQESLRLYPPAWMIPRIAQVDTTLGGKSIRAGTRVVASPFVSHRNSDFFKQPELFIPERWLKQSAPMPKGLFYPFGMGNRICIGERYGKLTVKIIILAAIERGRVFKSNHARIKIDNHALLLNPSPEVQFRVSNLP